MPSHISNPSPWQQLLRGVALATALTGVSATVTADVRESRLHNFTVTTVVDGLEHPWGMAFLPDGGILVTELPGRLRLVRDGQLVDEPIAGVPTVRVGGQGGLLDVALHPDFAINSLVYLSFAKGNEDDSEGTTAVVRGRLEGHRLHDVVEIFEADAWWRGRGHHGSRLLFDADGYLYVSIGDRQHQPAGDLWTHPAQDLGNHAGTLVRLHDDGRVPVDNPFVDKLGAHKEIWSYGHRNPQGLGMHPVSGEIWMTEHGPQGGDELNFIQPGKNYGWPVVGRGVNYGTGSTIHLAPEMEGMESPVHYWTPSIATTGLMIYNGDKFPRWQGNVFIGAISNGHRVLARLEVNAERFVVTQERLLEGEMRFRDVRQGPDGHIYLAIIDAANGLTPIVRLEPAD